MKKIETTVPEVGDKITIEQPWGLEIYVYKGIEENGYHYFETTDGKDMFTCDAAAFYSTKFNFYNAT